VDFLQKISRIAKILKLRKKEKQQKSQEKVVCKRSTNTKSASNLPVSKSETRHKLTELLQETLCFGLYENKIIYDNYIVNIVFEQPTIFTIALKNEWRNLQKLISPVKKSLLSTLTTSIPILNLLFGFCTDDIRMIVQAFIGKAPRPSFR